MPVRARAVANEFIHLAKADGRSLTPLQLIKLTYIAHGWMLALYGRPLIVDEVEAWKYGPVIPDLYQAMRRYGSAYVTKDLGTWGSRAASRLDETERGITHQVYRAYGEQNGVQLSRLTHQSGTPWYQTRNASGQNAVIANDLIAEHYRLLNDERRAKSTSGRS
jgi:uncharacterized phage-associated protein